jgi:hypothetical protein
MSFCTQQKYKEIFYENSAQQKHNKQITFFNKNNNKISKNKNLNDSANTETIVCRRIRLNIGKTVKTCLIYICIYKKFFNFSNVIDKI